MGFSRQENGSGFPFPGEGNVKNYLNAMFRFIGRIDAAAETPVLCPPRVKS